MVDRSKNHRAISLANIWSLEAVRIQRICRHVCVLSCNKHARDLIRTHTSFLRLIGMQNSSRDGVNVAFDKLDDRYKS